MQETTSEADHGTANSTNVVLWQPVPRFNALTSDGRNFNFDHANGQRVVLCLLARLPTTAVRPLLEQLQRVRRRMGALDCVFVGVSTRDDESHTELFGALLPDAVLLRDADGAISRLYQGDHAAPPLTGPLSFVIDERQRLLAITPCDPMHTQAHVQRLLQVVATLPALAPRQLAAVQAPVLVVPRVFEPTLCRDLIDYYERQGGETSGFMRDVRGRTVLVHDEQRKRRRDRNIDDAALRDACMRRIFHRLLPEVEKAFQFKATRNERYIVACYDASDSGFFRAHRDNTTRGTAHRRFAVSLNLNTGDYAGGQLRFPEFGKQLYQPPLGGAVVFSCGLLHEAMPVTRGKRYVFLPFLYDEEGARIRQDNAQDNFLYNA